MKANEEKVSSYLSFKLADEEFALHVEKVLNILEMTKITEIPKAPYYMKGVINLRGTVLPVIDTRLKFGMTKTEYTEKTCIIVMELTLDNNVVLVGSLVDEVLSVLEIASNEIQAPPSIGSKYRAEFINGMAKVNEKFTMLLDMEKVFTLNELFVLKDNMKQEVIES